MKERVIMGDSFMNNYLKKKHFNEDFEDFIEEEERDEED